MNSPLLRPRPGRNRCTVPDALMLILNRRGRGPNLVVCGFRPILACDRGATRGPPASDRLTMLPDVLRHLQKQSQLTPRPRRPPGAPLPCVRRATRSRRSCCSSHAAPGAAAKPGCSHVVAQHSLPRCRYSLQEKQVKQYEAASPGDFRITPTQLSSRLRSATSGTTVTSAR